MEKKATYLDYNATTPLKPSVLELMTQVLAETGNASSIHQFGRRARKRVETAREQIANLVGTHANQVIFTSGATESNNAVLKAFSGERILISAIEHPSVRGAAPDAEIIPVTKEGLIDDAAFQDMLKTGPAPALISIMMVNNETGVIQPVSELARMARSMHPDVYIHCDAAQASERIKIDFPALHVDYMSLSAHKMGGPQGVGALINAPGTRPARLLYGGGQEKRQRAGTENVAGIAGFGEAGAQAQQDLEKYQQLAMLRDKLEQEILKAAPAAILYGTEAPRVVNTTMLSLPGVSSETMMMALDLEGIAVSGGSACSSGTIKPSAVLLAMGIDEQEASSTLRISLGWGTDEDDIDHFIDAWSKLIKRTMPEQQSN